MPFRARRCKRRRDRRKRSFCRGMGLIKDFRPPNCGRRFFSEGTNGRGKKTQQKITCVLKKTHFKSKMGVTVLDSCYTHYCRDNQADEPIAKVTHLSFPDVIGESSFLYNQRLLDCGFCRNDERPSFCNYLR